MDISPWWCFKACDRLSVLVGEFFYFFFGISSKNLLCDDFLIGILLQSKWISNIQKKGTIRKFKSQR